VDYATPFHDFMILLWSLFSALIELGANLSSYITGHF